MTTRVLVPLAEGFEEIETVTIVDVLRRAELEVTLAGLSPRSAPGSTSGSSSGPISEPIRGSRGIRVQPDVDWSAVDPAAFDVLVLPGGMGGTLCMIDEPTLLDAVRTNFAAGHLTAAICAAPMVLEAAGILSDGGSSAFTAHPSVHGRLPGGRLERTERVVRSGHLLTSQGPGTAMEFALAIVAELVGPGKARELAEAMVVA